MTAWYNKGVYGVDHYSAPSIYNLSGAISITPQLNGTIWRPVSLVGNMTILFGINSANPNKVYALQGNIDISPIFGAHLNNKNTLGAGSMNIYMPFVDSGVVVGPIWQPSGVCPDPKWALTGPCNG
jgi:hypothetical protein